MYQTRHVAMHVGMHCLLLPFRQISLLRVSLVEESSMYATRILCGPLNTARKTSMTPVGCADLQDSAGPQPRFVSSALWSCCHRETLCLLERAFHTDCVSIDLLLPHPKIQLRVVPTNRTRNMTRNVETVLPRRVGEDGDHEGQRYQTGPGDALPRHAGKGERLPHHASPPAGGNNNTPRHSLLNLLEFLFSSYHVTPDCATIYHRNQETLLQELDESVLRRE